LGLGMRLIRRGLMIGVFNALFHRRGKLH
jgi:hypothetical protein